MLTYDAEERQVGSQFSSLPLNSNNIMVGVMWGVLHGSEGCPVVFVIQGDIETEAAHVGSEQ